MAVALRRLLLTRHIIKHSKVVSYVASASQQNYHVRSFGKLQSPLKICHNTLTTKAAEQRNAVAVRSESVVSASVDQGSRLVKTEWSNGRKLNYPFIWLRDNCQCESCFHPSTKTRIALLRNLDLNAEPEGLQVSM